MPLKTSWFKKELSKNDFRQVGWIGLMYTVVLIFALPLNVAMQLGQDNLSSQIQEEGYHLFEFMPVIQLIMLFTAPVLLAVFSFRFMQVKQSADFMHSLPIHRILIYLHKIGYGILLLILTDLVISLILLIMASTVDVSAFYTISDIFPWFGLTLLFQLFVFSVGTFVGMITGLSVIQGLFTYIFLLLPSGISILIFYNLDLVLNGYPEPYFIEEKVMQFSPITDSVNMLYELNISFMKMFIYGFLTIIIFLISYWLYKNRSVEAASQAVAFSPLRPVFIYSFTFCMTLLGGLYFGYAQKGTGWLVFGYIIASIIGYLVAQMILAKTWRVFTNWKSYLYFIIGFTILAMLIVFDVTGYQERVPETSKVEKVYIMDNHNHYAFNQIIDEMDKGMESKEIISDVMELHQYLIEHGQETKIDENSSEFTIKYQLENGREVIRQYYIANNANLDSLLKPIYETEEYKKTNELFTLTNLKQMEISNYRYGRYDTTIYDQRKIEQAMNALKKDFLAQSYEDMQNNAKLLADVELTTTEDKYIYFPIKATTTSFIAWLKQENLYDEVIVDAEDIEAVYVREFNAENDDIYNNNLYKNLDSDEVVKITDKNKITELMNSGNGENYGKDLVYGMAFKVKNDPQLQIDIIDTDHIPQFITDAFK
ncbi:DUF6449 domain-containing protein [Paraliobacillus ryukyuensis]|uniref:DUF6449 domain-containing protein n=1 Tax=Paraliobacillus ryukyuensis TaxID=200904 RepID=UPI0009A8485B|nr:DUF6449 domain-containing protein [Paraliobacillus ryukyuensis]